VRGLTAQGGLLHRQPPRQGARLGGLKKRGGCGWPLPDGGRSLHEQSHGESFIALALHRFGPQGLYVLDEPEAALSPLRQMSMLRRMHDLVQQGCQFIVATHAPILLAYPEAWIYELDECGLQRVEYEDTATVKVAREFLEGRERTLGELFTEEREEG